MEEEEEEEIVITVSEQLSSGQLSGEQLSK